MTDVIVELAPGSVAALAAAASASAAATSATNAATSATNAATSATNASNSADAAEAAETNAEAAQTAAETAETNAEASEAQTLVYRNQTAVLAAAAGAPSGETLPTLPDGDYPVSSYFRLLLGPGIKIYRNDANVWVDTGIWERGPEFDTVALLLADTSTSYGGTGVIVKAGGYRYEQAASGATDHHVTTAGGVKLYDLQGRNAVAAAKFASRPDGTIVEMAGLKYEVDSTATGTASATNDLGVPGLRPFGDTIYLEHYGITNSSDIAVMLGAAMSERPKVITVKQKYTALTLGATVVKNLSVGGADHPGLIVDLVGSHITKTGAHTSDCVYTEGVLNLIVSNMTIDADSKAARCWYHSSDRTEFTGFCRFANCFAENVLQTENAVAAIAWRVSGAMDVAEMIGGGATNVTPDASVSSKITRGFQTSTNFAAELVGQRNFPRVTICRFAKFDTITDDSDGDAIATLHATSAADWSKSVTIVEDCEITDAKKRAVKTQTAWTEIRRSIVRHTVDAGGLTGEEFGVQLGGGIIEDNHVYYDGTPRGVAWLGVATDPADFGRQVFRRNKVYLLGGDATSGLYTKTSLVLGAEMLSDAVYHPGLDVSGNEVIGGSYKHLLHLRPRSRSTGIVTVGPVVVEGNICDLTDGLVAFKRAGPVPGDTSAFFSQIELLTIARNTNTLSDVPAIDEIDTNVTYTRSGWDENKGITVPRGSADIQTYEFSVPYGLSNVAHTFDIPFTGTDVQSFEVSATVSVAGATTRQSHFMGYLHVASGTITEYAIDRRDDAYTGLWSFSILSSPDRLRVTKAAGAGGNAIRGHVTIKLKG